MAKKQHLPLIRTGAAPTSLLAAALYLLSPPLLAQHGHPLVGTWSGDLDGGEQRVRIVLALEFNVDQSISGFVIANGDRLPLTAASLDPHGWEVALTAEGRDRAGNAVSYEMQGTIENLGSPADRAIAGTWRQGASGGEFRMVRNN